MTDTVVFAEQGDGLWMAFSLLFGAFVAMAAAVMARHEDDCDARPDGLTVRACSPQL